MNSKILYSEELREKIKSRLLEVNGKEVDIHEWKNFIDYTIIPIILEYIYLEEKEMKA